MCFLDQLSPVFVPQRLSGKALTLPREKAFDFI